MMLKIAEQVFEDPVLGFVFHFKQAPDGTARILMTGMGDEHAGVSDMIRNDGLTRDYAFGESGKLAGCGTYVVPPSGPIEGS